MTFAVTRSVCVVLDYIYDNKQARGVSVDSAAISAALRKVYEAAALGDEIESGK